MVFARPFAALCGHSRPFAALCGPLQPCVVIFDLLRSFAAVHLWDLFDPSRLFAALTRQSRTRHHARQSRSSGLPRATLHSPCQCYSGSSIGVRPDVDRFSIGYVSSSPPLLVGKRAHRPVVGRPKLRGSGIHCNSHQRRFSPLSAEERQGSQLQIITGHQGKSPSCDWPTFATEEGLGLGILRLCSACLGTYIS